MKNTGVFRDHFDIFMPCVVLYGHLVYFVGIFYSFVLFFLEKSGNPADGLTEQLMIPS
jgi:hypothetical protein